MAWPWGLGVGLLQLPGPDPPFPHVATSLLMFRKLWVSRAVVLSLTLWGVE